MLINNLSCLAYSPQVLNLYLFYCFRAPAGLWMDAALLAEREAFKRRAMAVPIIENKKMKVSAEFSLYKV